jgi:hypothetical protein
MKAESGDQNGWYAPSVPGSSRGASVSRSRTHSRPRPLPPNAIIVPSGEITGPSKSGKRFS